jgi:Ca-activated chloride channel family protein
VIVPGTDLQMLHPQFLLLLPLALVIAAWAWGRRAATIRFSDVKRLRAVGGSGRIRARTLLRALQLLILSLFIVAMARPRVGWRERQIHTYGLDIIMAIDVSESMTQMDFSPNRLEAAKRVTSDFLDGREFDRIGVVIFGKSAFTLCPLTLDYGVIKDFIKRLRFERLGKQPTALGLGLGTAVNKLKDSDAKGRVVVLLTDGVDTVGGMDPLVAADTAESLGIKVYTIGVGSTGMPDGASLFFGGGFQGSFDEETLRAIADKTGGKYFHATDNKSLEKIYEEIDRLEKTKTEYTEYDHYDEKAGYVLGPALLLLLLEILLSRTWLAKLP